MSDDPIALLAKDAGEWEAEVEIRPAPGAEPIRQKGLASNRLMGGRWLIMDYRADSGFEGHGIYGWDATRGKYTASWVDSGQTCIARSEGTWDAATETMTYLTEATHAGRTLRYREITQRLPDGTRLYRNLIPTPDGGEHELIRMVYRKR